MAQTPYYPVIYKSFKETLRDRQLAYSSYISYMQARSMEDSEFRAQFLQELLQIKTLVHVYRKNHKKSPVSWNLYYLLCIFGGIYSLCSGFDGMVSVLSLVVPQLYLGLLIGLGVLSALCSLGIFIARDRPVMLDSLNLEHDPYHSLFDEYLYLLQEWNYSSMDSKWRFNSERGDFEGEHAIAVELRTIFREKKILNQEKKSSIWVSAQVNFVMLIGAILFFSDGFFIGENVALLFAPLLAVDSFSVTLGLSLMMGIFALAAYWYVERTSLKDYLYNHISTDEDLRKSSAGKNKKVLSRLSIFFGTAPEAAVDKTMELGPSELVMASVAV